MSDYFNTPVSEQQRRNRYLNAPEDEQVEFLAHYLMNPAQAAAMPFRKLNCMWDSFFKKQPVSP
jgi:hypothetical protein